MKKRTIEHSNKEAEQELDSRGVRATQQTSTVNRGGREEEGRKKGTKKHQEERKNKSRKSTTTTKHREREISSCLGEERDK